MAPRAGGAAARSGLGRCPHCPEAAIPPLIRFAAPEATPLVRAAGATIAAFARRGWTCVLDAQGAGPALGPLGAVSRAAGTPDLTVGPGGDLQPAKEEGASDAFALRVHEGLDAKLAALGALRGGVLSESEARGVLAEALALGAGTGAEGFVARDAGARTRLAALLRCDEGWRSSEGGTL